MEGLSEDQVRILQVLYSNGGWVRPSGLGIWLQCSPASYFPDLLGRGLLECRQYISSARFMRNNNRNSLEYKLSREGALLVESILSAGLL